MSDRLRRATPWVLALAGMLVIPFTTENSKILTVAILTFTVATLATSWNILGGFAGQVSLGHAAFFGLGALITRQVWLGGRSLVISIVAAVVATSVVAAVIGVPMLRLRGVYFSIGTLAAAEAIRLTIGNLLPEISSLRPETLRNYDFVSRYLLTLGVLVLSVLVAMLLTRSKLGLGMQAVRGDEEAAAATGVNVFGHKLIAFVLSAGLAALGGAAYGYFAVSYYPSFTFSPVWTFDAILVVFVGGVGTVAGPLLGSAFFVLIRDQLAASLVDFHVIIFGILFIIVVLLLPGGILEGGRRLTRLASRSGA